MNVLDGIRKRFDDANRHAENYRESMKREKEKLNFDKDANIVYFVIDVLKNNGVITAEKADEYNNLWDGRTFISTEWGDVYSVSMQDFLKSMLEEIANKNVRVFYWHKPFPSLSCNNLIPHCFVELGKEKLFNEYKKYFEKLETHNFVAIVITDYKALLVAMKAEFQDKIAKRDAEAKALRKKYEEEIAFYEQIRQAKAKCHEVEAKEYNNEHPNFLCRAAIKSADEELSQL